MPTLNELIQNLATAETDVEKLRNQIAEAQSKRDADPVEYLARLVYDNKKVYGSYGYDYSDFGESERQCAQEVLDVVDGYVDIAEKVIVRFRIK
ncbi:MAG: hypothetical protein E6R04_05035 [Spirochaetes bacterium]|nr:MAG: hypothetical protein E6R04_05035 [Spirochaetota bacterium]